jgi:hypothetical protein
VPVSRIRAARAAAMLSCALVLTLSACNNSESAPAGGGGHEGGHQAPHSGSHPTSHHTPAAPTGEFNPRNCPTGLVR